MQGTWHGIVDHLGTWTVSGITGFIGVLIGSALRWRWPSWKEYQEERQAKRDKVTDARVMELLDGIDSSTMFAKRISDTLKIDEHTVRESLDRLQARGRVGMGDPTSLSPASWFSLNR
jgi:hypothetical protein